MPASYLKRNILFAQFTAEVDVPYGVLNPILMGRVEPDVLPNTLGSILVAVLSSRLHNGNEAFHSTGPEQGIFQAQQIVQSHIKLVEAGADEHPIVHLGSSVELYGAFTHIAPTGYIADNLPGGLSADTDGSITYERAKLAILHYPEHNTQLLGHISLTGSRSLSHQHADM